ncbi:PREDICTED: uncharacterized protein LOC104820207 [Tarenaya hassleriana]|uniref:uncharacterized protein LOC104820207 n=1 Tax=Tarenaya hassleriana TaxID=28532 RepID=UPI00053C8755|nr:PREDICTED: uncharacterized protein LOC104820207 [Tarenaya hassleriana]
MGVGAEDVGNVNADVGVDVGGNVEGDVGVEAGGSVDDNVGVEADDNAEPNAEPEAGPEVDVNVETDANSKLDEETITAIFREIELKEYARNCEEYVSDEEYVDNENVCPGTPLGTDEFERPRRKVPISRVLRKGDELLLLGTIFESGEEFKDALFQYVLDTQYNVRLSRWEKDKYATVCSHKGCGWRVYCSIEKPVNKWMIKVYQPGHNHEPTGVASMLSSKHIAKLFSDIIRRMSGFSAADMQYVIKRKWKLKVPLTKCFKNCHPVLGLDGCFLKWKIKGELLAAVGRDADNRIYPIAWAVVHAETSDTWNWFVRKLKSDLCLGVGEHITILFDKQKGLMNAIENELPLVEHRMCARHVYANWKKVFKGLDLKLLFWKVATSFHSVEYATAMDELKDKDPMAHEALVRQRPEQWARSFFKEGSQCGDVHNNLSESFNRTIKAARLRPVIDMLEDIRRQTMQRIAKRCVESSKWNKEFSPKAVLALGSARERTKYCTVTPGRRGMYEVMEFGITYGVDLTGKSCACRRWDLTGVLCHHALSVIHEKEANISGFVSEYYLTTKWTATYSDNLMPVNGQTMWHKTGKTPLDVPEDRGMRGRPKKFHRRKDPHESPTRPGKMSRHGRVFTWL